MTARLSKQNKGRGIIASPPSQSICLPDERTGSNRCRAKLAHMQITEVRNIQNKNLEKSKTTQTRKQVPESNSFVSVSRLKNATANIEVENIILYQL